MEHEGYCPVSMYEKHVWAAFWHSGLNFRNVSDLFRKLGNSSWSSPGVCILSRKELIEQHRETAGRLLPGAGRLMVPCAAFAVFRNGVFGLP